MYGEGGSQVLPGTGDVAEAMSSLTTDLVQRRTHRSTGPQLQRDRRQLNGLVVGERVERALRRQGERIGGPAHVPCLPQVPGQQQRVVLHL